MLCLCASLSKRPFGDRNDETGFLDQRDKLIGRNDATFGMVPPNERLDTCNLIVVEADLWLVKELELLIRERASKIVFECLSSLQPDVHFFFKEARCPATF